MAGVSLRQRAALHRALGDEHRLAILDALQLSDRTPTELRGLTGLPSNLLAFHLDALERVSLIARQRSQGDRRRRYVTLRPTTGDGLDGGEPLPGELVLFVCTHNSARSQLAAALWTQRTGLPSSSAGTEPAEAVHPLAIEVARAHGLDLSRAQPRRYADLPTGPALVVSVCDRAREFGLPFDAPLLHWSVRDPAGGGRADFEVAYETIRGRIDRLARQVAA